MNITEKSVVLSKERQGEIALLLIKAQMSRKSIPAPTEIKRELGNIAKEIGIELNELIDFAKPIYEEALNKGFMKFTIVRTK